MRRNADQMDDAGLHDRRRPHVADHLRQSLQPVADDEEHVLDAAVTQIGQHAHPELGVRVIVDWTREFDRWWSHVQSLAEARPDPTNARVFRLTVAQIQYLQDLSAEPLEETPTLRRVVRSSRYPLWWVSHPYETDIAVRLIVWSLPSATRWWSWR